MLFLLQEGKQNLQKKIRNFMFKSSLYQLRIMQNSWKIRFQKNK